MTRLIICMSGAALKAGPVAVEECRIVKAVMSILELFNANADLRRGCMRGKIRH